MTLPPKIIAEGERLAKAVEIQAWFRVLAGWEIVYAPDGDYKGEVTVHPCERRAHIKLNLPGVSEKDYLFHEMLHIAYRAAGRMGMEGEELFVRDICKINAELLAAARREVGLREALINICKHQEVVCPTGSQRSTTWTIANNALAATVEVE